MDKIIFKPFAFQPGYFKKYLQEFKKLKASGLLYAKTPETCQEIKAWFSEILSSKETEYYFIYFNGKLAGHLGLREINYQLKTANIGSVCFSPYLHCASLIEQTLQFSLKLAQKKGLKMLLADVAEKDSLRMTVLINLGFKRDPVVSHCFFLTL